ncbi:MAG: 3-keto-L-gulonate-6-phosphate decarboxylase UlaD [Alphaproteobacteria bacterium]
MTKPLIQVALDNTNITSAVNDARILGPWVDIVEVGTILSYAEGMQATRVIKAMFPDKTIITDLKIADAGKTLAEMAFNAGCDWTTVICSASPETKLAAYNVAMEHNGEVQIELYGNWTLDDAKSWVDMGIKQAIYHRSRDSQLAGQNWGQADLDKLVLLSQLGLQLSVTGGLVTEDIHLFKNIPVKTFIAGRSLRDAESPKAYAETMRNEINKYWK